MDVPEEEKVEVPENSHKTFDKLLNFGTIIRDGTKGAWSMGTMISRFASLPLQRDSQECGMHAQLCFDLIGLASHLT